MAQWALTRLASRRSNPPRLRQYQRLWHLRALSRPAVIRFHRPGDERVYGGDRRGRWAAPARRAADRRFVAGLTARSGSCAALVRRGRTGRGDTVGAEPQQRDRQPARLSRRELLRTGDTPARSGNDHAIVSPYGMFRTADGEVALAPSQEQSYQRLLDALGAPELRDDPRFRTNDLGSPTAPR